MRVTNKHVFFWGEWPSNWFKCHFTVEHNGKELHFFNSEQYFMWVKAITFGDEEVAEKILKKVRTQRLQKLLAER